MAARALKLFEFMVVSSELTAEVVIPKIFYWVQTLINGVTIKNVENKKEIFEEILSLVPDWIETSVKVGKGKS